MMRARWNTELKFQVGDCLHAKPKVKFLKQNIMQIVKINRVNVQLEDILTRKKYSFPKKSIQDFFEKTYCYIPAKHPITNIFQ